MVTVDAGSPTKDRSVRLEREGESIKRSGVAAAIDVSLFLGGGDDFRDVECWRRRLKPGTRTASSALGDCAFSDSQSALP